MLIRYFYVIVLQEGKLVWRELSIEYIGVIKVDPRARILNKAVLAPKLLLYTFVYTKNCLKCIFHT